MEMIAEKEKLRRTYIETFAFSVPKKLKQNSCCRVITVFIHTNRFRKELGEYKNGLSVVLPNPSNSSIVLAKAANSILNHLQVSLQKAGVIVSDFVPENERLINLFEKDLETKHLPIMKAMDSLNKNGKTKYALHKMETNLRRKLLPEYEEFWQHAS